MDRVIAQIADAFLHLHLRGRDAIRPQRHRQVRIGNLKDALQAAYFTGLRDGHDSFKCGIEKRILTRSELDKKCPHLTYQERDRLLSEWVRYPLPAVRRSLAAGCIYPDLGNPYLPKRKNRRKRTAT